MKAFSLKNTKWLIAPAITLAIIGAMWSYYALVYVPSQIEYFSGRNLRILATMGSEITSTLRIYENVIKKDVAIGGEKEIGGSANSAKQKSLSYAIEHSFVPSGTGFEWRTSYTHMNADSAKADNAKIEKGPRLLDLQRAEFDIVLVADEAGKVLFQQAPAGIQIVRLNQLTEAKNASPKDGGDAKSKDSEKGDGDEKKEKSPKPVGIALPDNTEIWEITFAGQVYKLFLLPVQVPVKLDTVGPDSAKDKEHWTIAGLVRTSRFLSECKSISYTARSVVICLIIVVLVSTPLVRILTLGRRERVRPLDVVMLAYSLLMGTGLFTLVLADMLSYTSVDKHLNHEAGGLAKQIAENVRKEIRQAYEQLVLLTKQAESDFERARAQDATNPKAAKPYTGAKNLFETQTHLVKEPYPFFRVAFWMDPEGYQRVKWFALSGPTNFLSVKKRPYFQHVRDDQLWTIPVAETSEEVVRLWVEPIYSWTTAENTTVLAIPVSPILPIFDGWAAALETRFLALINPVLPIGFGYAVIDGSGQVLFHSDERRNLRESFIEETDHNRVVQAALAGHIEQVGDGLYWGHDHYFVVRPLERLPWTLVVFRDKEFLRTANAEGLATAAIMFVFYALIMSVLFTVSWAFFRLRRFPQKYRTAWLWLRTDKHQAYRNILLLNSGMALVFVVILLWGSASLMILAGVFAPIVAAGHSVLQWQRRLPGGPKGTNATELLYHAVAVSFVAVLGVLPALSVFKIAYQAEHELFLKQGQASLAAGLVDRERRVRKDFAKVEEKFQVPENLKEEYLQKRLPKTNASKRLDIYSQFFADTTIEHVDESAIHNVPLAWAEEQLRRLLSTIRIQFNNLATESSGLMGTASGDGSSIWESHDGRLTLYYRSIERPQISNSVIALSSNRLLPLNWEILLAATLAITLLASLFLIVGRVGRLVFGSHLPTTSGYKTPQGSDQPFIGGYGGNLLVLGSRLPHGVIGASSHIIDLESVMAEDAWIDTVRADIAKASAGPIALLNWDRHADNPLGNQQKLRLLRELLTEGRSLCIQSRTDPTHLELNGDSGSHSERTWLHALRSFTRTYPNEEPGDVASFEKFVGDQERQALEELNAATPEEKKKRQVAIRTGCRILREECSASACLQTMGSEILQRFDLSRMTGGEVWAAISHAATGYYHQLWATCSSGEQYVLFALAKDGFVLTMQPDVRNLFTRGLIERKPTLVPFNTTFCQWILDEVSDPVYAQAWRKGEPQQTLAKARHVMVALLLALGLFLYATQQEVDHLLEFATALFAGIPIIAEWLGQWSGEKTASATAT